MDAIKFVTIEYDRWTHESLLKDGPVLVCPDVSLVPVLQWSTDSSPKQRTLQGDCTSYTTSQNGSQSENVDPSDAHSKVDDEGNLSPNEPVDQSLLSQLRFELPNVLQHLSNDPTDTVTDMCFGVGETHMPSFETDSLERASVIPDLSSNCSPGDDIFNMRVESLSDDVFETESDTNRRLGIYQTAVYRQNGNSCHLPLHSSLTGNNNNTPDESVTQNNGHSDDLTSTDSVDISFSSGSYTTDLDALHLLAVEGEVERREEFIICDVSDHFEFNNALRTPIDLSENEQTASFNKDAETPGLESQYSEFSTQVESVSPISEDSKLYSLNEERDVIDACPVGTIFDDDVNVESSMNISDAQSNKHTVPNVDVEHTLTPGGISIGSDDQTNYVAKDVGLKEHAQVDISGAHTNIISETSDNADINVLCVLLTPDERENACVALSTEDINNDNTSKGGDNDLPVSSKGGDNDLPVSVDTSTGYISTENTDTNGEFLSSNAFVDVVPDAEDANKRHATNAGNVNDSVALDIILQNHDSIEHKGFCTFRNLNTAQVDVACATSQESESNYDMGDIDIFVSDIIDYAMNLLMANQNDQLPAEPSAVNHSFNSIDRLVDDSDSSICNTLLDERPGNNRTVLLDYSQTEYYDNVTYVGSLATIPEVDPILENYAVSSVFNETSSGKSSQSSIKDIVSSIPEFDGPDGQVGNDVNRELVDGSLRQPVIDDITTTVCISHESNDVDEAVCTGEINHSGIHESFNVEGGIGQMDVQPVSHREFNDNALPIEPSEVIEKVETDQSVLTKNTKYDDDIFNSVQTRENLNTEENINTGSLNDASNVLSVENVLTLHDSNERNTESLKYVETHPVDEQQEFSAPSNTNVLNDVCPSDTESSSAKTDVFTNAYNGQDILTISNSDTTDELLKCIHGDSHDDPISNDNDASTNNVQCEANALSDIRDTSETLETNEMKPMQSNADKNCNISIDNTDKQDSVGVHTDIEVCPNMPESRSLKFEIDDQKADVIDTKEREGSLHLSEPSYTESTEHLTDIPNLFIDNRNANGKQNDTESSDQQIITSKVILNEANSHGNKETFSTFKSELGNVSQIDNDSTKMDVVTEVPEGNEPSSISHKELTSNNDQENDQSVTCSQEQDVDSTNGLSTSPFVSSEDLKNDVSKHSPQTNMYLSSEHDSPSRESETKYNADSIAICPEASTTADLNHQTQDCLVADDCNIDSLRHIPTVNDDLSDSLKSFKDCSRNDSETGKCDQNSDKKYTPSCRERERENGETNSRNDSIIDESDQNVDKKQTPPCTERESDVTYLRNDSETGKSDQKVDTKQTLQCTGRESDVTYLRNDSETGKSDQKVDTKQTPPCTGRESGVTYLRNDSETGKSDQKVDTKQTLPCIGRESDETYLRNDSETGKSDQKVDTKQTPPCTERESNGTYLRNDSETGKIDQKVDTKQTPPSTGRESDRTNSRNDSILDESFQKVDNKQTPSCRERESDETYSINNSKTGKNVQKVDKRPIPSCTGHANDEQLNVETEASRKARLLSKILKSNLSSDLIRRPEYRHHSRYQSKSLNTEDQHRANTNAAQNENPRVRKSKSFDIEYSHAYPRLYKDLAHRDIFLSTSIPKPGSSSRYRSLKSSRSLDGDHEHKGTEHQKGKILERTLADDILCGTHGRTRNNQHVTNVDNKPRPLGNTFKKGDNTCSPDTEPHAGQNAITHDIIPSKLEYIQYISSTRPYDQYRRKSVGQAADASTTARSHDEKRQRSQSSLETIDNTMTVNEIKGVPCRDSNIYNIIDRNDTKYDTRILDKHSSSETKHIQTVTGNHSDYPGCKEERSGSIRNSGVISSADNTISDVTYSDAKRIQTSLGTLDECEGSLEELRDNSQTESNTLITETSRDMTLNYDQGEATRTQPIQRYHADSQSDRREKRGKGGINTKQLKTDKNTPETNGFVATQKHGETKRIQSNEGIKKRTAFTDGTFKVKRLSSEENIQHGPVSGSRSASRSADVPDADLKDYIDAIQLEDVFYDKSVISYQFPSHMSNNKWESDTRETAPQSPTEISNRINKQKHTSFDEKSIRRDELTQKRIDDSVMLSNANLNHTEMSKTSRNSKPPSNHSRILKDTQQQRLSEKSNFCENTGSTSNRVSRDQFSKGRVTETHDRSLIDIPTSRSFNQNNGRTGNNVNKPGDTRTVITQSNRGGLKHRYGDNISVPTRRNKGRTNGAMRIQENLEIKQKDGPLSLTDAYGPMETNDNHSGHALTNSANHLSESMTSLSNRHAPAVSPSRQSTLSKQHSLQSTHSELNGDHRQDEGIKFERLKNLPEEDLMVKIREIIGHMERLEDYHRGDGMRIQKMLGDMYWDYTHMREMIGDCMADGGYAVVSMTMLKTLNSIGIFKNDDVWFPTYYTYNTMWNFTDASSKLAKALSENDAVRLLTLNCGHKPYINAIHSKNVYYVIKASLSILHNIARNSGMKHLFDENKTSETIMPFLESEDEMLKILATLTIANIVDEEENKTIISESGTIHDIVNWIEKSISLPRRRYKGFTPQELTEGLNKLAVNDSNKMRIVDEGSLPLFLQMLQHDDIREQSSAARIVWTLCFDKDVRQKINENTELVATLQKLTDSTNKSLQTNCSGALWVIKGDNEVSTEKRPKTNKSKTHVFLSYAWPDKELVLNIRDKLRAEGYAIWIDIEKMGKATLDTMTEAIENSAVVLVCMSEKYKQSPNCRTEAEYTFQLKKDYIPLMMQKKYRPDGWVGTILGAKLYFDFSGKYPFEKSFQGLLKELRGRGKVTPNTTPGDNNDNHSDPAMVHSLSLSSHTSAGTPVHHMPLNSAILNMGQEELIKWLRNTKLTELLRDTQYNIDRNPDKIPVVHCYLPVTTRCQYTLLTCNFLRKRCIPAFMEFDGRLLMQLKVMRTEAPEFFYQCLEKRLNMSLIEILKFTRALEELQ